MSSVRLNRTMGITRHEIETKIDISGGLEASIKVTASRIPGSIGAREQRTGLPLEPDYPAQWEIDKIIVTETIYDGDDDDPSRSVLYFKGAEFRPTDDEHNQIIEALDNSLTND